MPTPDTGDEYDTKLSPEEEAEFKRMYPDPRDTYDYDMRGAFKAGVQPDPVTGHMPDTFKKPNHITFSDNSMYHGQGNLRGGHWTRKPDGSWDFKPGPTNLQNYSPEELQRYFQQYEKGNSLTYPDAEY